MADEPSQPQQGTQDAPPATADATPADAPQNPPQDAQRAPGPAAGDTDGDPVDQTSDVQALRHEAASRRRALRTVEAERDQLKERVDRHDRAEAERLVSDGLADPSDLWGAVGLDAVRGEDGAVDEAKVGDALAGLLERKPHFRKPSAQPNLHQGARQEVAEAGPSFGQQLKQGGR
jgi:hypothetical protein